MPLKTPKDYIERSLGLHPSLLADRLLDDAITHTRHAAITYNSQARNAALQMVDDCNLAVELILNDDLDAIMDRIALWVPVFHHAARLNCMGQWARHIVEEFPKGQ